MLEVSASGGALWPTSDQVLELTNERVEWASGGKGRGAHRGRAGVLSMLGEGLSKSDSMTETGGAEEEEDGIRDGAEAPGLGP